MRLDFDTFTITGPSTLTTSTVKTIGGSVATDGAESSGASQCATDLFSVTNPGGSNTPPSICGTNTGEHSMIYFFTWNRIFFKFQNFQTVHSIMTSKSNLGLKLKTFKEKFQIPIPKKNPRIFRIVQFELQNLYTI